MSGFSRTYDVLESLYQPCDSKNHLSVSVDAVSLAYFSFQYGAPKALHLARKQYLGALPVLNKALQSSQHATTDATLLAVLLLDLYEKFTSGDPRSAESWLGHVNGALAMVRLRDSEHLSDYAGRRLSIRLATNLTISLIAANTAVPFGLIKLRSDLKPFVKGDDPKWQCSGLCLKYANLRAMIEEGNLSRDGIITRARELDQEFLSVMAEMPPTWLYSTMQLDGSSGTDLDSYFDSYHDHHITQTWNVLRAMRILLQKIIQDWYQEIIRSIPGTLANEVVKPNDCGSIGDVVNGHVWLDSHQQVTDNPYRYTMTALDASGFSLRIQSTKETIDAISQDICASTPQYTTHRTKRGNDQDLPVFQKLQCYTLLWPLYVAGLHSSAERSVKSFAIRQLRFIADLHGIQNAAMVADILEKEEGINPWNVYAKLGSYAFAA